MGGWYSADTKRRYGLLRLRGLQKLLKIAVFGEDIRERLFDYIVCRCADECGVLIDLHSG